MTYLSLWYWFLGIEMVVISVSLYKYAWRVVIFFSALLLVTLIVGSTIIIRSMFYMNQFIMDKM